MKMTNATNQPHFICLLKYGGLWSHATRLLCAHSTHKIKLIDWHIQTLPHQISLTFIIIRTRVWWTSNIHGNPPQLAKVSWTSVMKYGHNSHLRVEADRYCPQEPTYGTTSSWWLTLRIEFSPPPCFKAIRRSQRESSRFSYGLHIKLIDRLLEEGGGTKVTSSTFCFHFSRQTCHKVNGYYSVTLLYRTPYIRLVFD